MTTFTTKDYKRSLHPFIVALAILIGCREPISITANPDDQTSTSGTAGSAKMTTQLPPKRDNIPLPDSLRIKDTARVVKDSMP